MITEPHPGGQRLDSWKAIAEYLQRDVATVRRWEKNLALPVHRVGGIGRSVFADPAEIDAWLKQAKPSLSAASVTVPVVSTGNPLQRQSWPWLLLLVVTFAFVIGLYARPGLVAVGDLSVEATASAVIARDSAGREQWRHDFPQRQKTFTPPVPVHISGGRAPGVYFATSYSARHDEEGVQGGVLSLFDMAGRQQRAFEFDDRVTFAGVAYGAPWAITAFAVNEADDSYRVAVSAHHYTWNPGLVTILDREWRRLGTFVHAGWVEQVRWLSADRLLIGGFSNAYDGGMVALLDTATMDGQGPAPARSRHVCESCGGGGPLRMFVFPRTEINRVSASPFNRVILQTSEGRVVARTIEMAAAGGDADAIYEFNRSLDVVSARLSERYWDLHRALEADGRITHRRDQCPDRDGPREVLMWESATGWRIVRI